MKKIWALFEGDKVLKKSVKKSDLLKLKNSPEGKKNKWYVTLYLGAIKFNSKKLKDI